MTQPILSMTTTTESCFEDGSEVFHLYTVQVRLQVECKPFGLVLMKGRMMRGMLLSLLLFTIPAALSLDAALLYAWAERAPAAS